MKTKFFAVLAAALMISVGGSVQAASVTKQDITSSYDYSWSESVGVAGDETLPSYALSGSLAANTQVVFEFSLTNGTIEDTTAVAKALSSGQVIAKTVDTGSNSSSDNLVSITSEVLKVLSVVADDSVTGTITFKNLKNEAVSISLLLSSWLIGGPGTFQIHATASSVPLPAALPLFGLGIASLAGYGMKRRKAA